MKEIKLFTKIGNGFKRMGFGLKKHSPEILVVTGAVGVVGGVVAACVATPKAEKIISEAKAKIKEYEDLAAGKVDIPDNAVYTDEDLKKDKLIVKAKTGAKLAAVYAPAAAIVFSSLALIFVSHNILSKRNAGIAAAYAAVSKGFDEYRNRVVEKYGKDVDDELKLGLKPRQVEETEKDENGKEKKVKKTISVADGNLGGSPYTFIFDSEHTMAYTGDNAYDMMELRMEQELANNLLKARGYIYLNEILDRLGLKTSKMGQVVGWVYNPDDNNADGFVDFGVREISIPNNDGELESKIVLDFNVQGNILDLMP